MNIRLIQKKEVLHNNWPYLYKNQSQKKRDVLMGQKKFKKRGQSQQILARRMNLGEKKKKYRIWVQKLVNYEQRI